MRNNIGSAAPLASLLFVALSGCDAPIASIRDEAEPRPALAAKYDPAAVGSVAGRVHWAGAVPLLPPINAAVAMPDGKIRNHPFPNPNAPRIDAQDHVVEGAVVFLEGVDPERARPWDHEQARVEIDLEQIRIFQGTTGPRHIGFAPVGDEIEMVSRDDYLHVLSARGAAFFGLAFPDPGAPLRRRFDQPGLVELSSGAARYWHRAYLWVGDHPYFALTDAAGRFSWPCVPPGVYQVVAWQPDGQIARIDRDPNTGMIMRYHFAEALQTTKPIRVETGRVVSVDCFLSK